MPGRPYGELGWAPGLVAGVAGGGALASASAGLPTFLVIAVLDLVVDDFAGRRARPAELLFALQRSGLQVTVRQRVNVRILDLTSADGSRVALEGSRVPLTHSKDVISARWRGGSLRSWQSKLATVDGWPTASGPQPRRR